MKLFPRRRFLQATGALALGGVFGPALAAERGTIRLLVGFAPGGGTDLVARLVAEKLREVLGQNVIVENMAGAGGRLAANATVAAAADGQTYMMANNAVHIFQTLMFANEIKWNYKADFTPVAGMTAYPLGLAVSAASGVTSLNEYAAWIKADPARAAFGTTGLGGQTHFTGEILGRALGLDLKAVPYKGATPMVTDLVGGHVPAAIGLMDDMLKFHRTGNLRVISIFSEKRSPMTPDIPTAIEQGYKVPVSDGWQGIWGPGRLPREHVERMQAAIKRVLEMPDVQQAMLTRLNVAPTFRTGAEMARVQDNELRSWEAIIKASRFKG